jgi:hypothetical protein
LPHFDAAFDGFDDVARQRARDRLRVDDTDHAGGAR